MWSLKLSTLCCYMTVLQIASITSGYVNECIHAWRERSESSQHCKVSADCQQLDAECVFSPLSDGYICCRLKKDAVAPECPDGRAATDKTKGIVLCDKGASGSVEDQCPYGFECTDSITDFTKNPSQPNNVCCESK